MRSELGPSELREAWTSWLSGKAAWSHLATATFAPKAWESDGPTSSPRLSRVVRAASKLEKRLNSALDAPSFFGVVEIGSWSGRMHLHFLLSSQDERFIRAALEEHRVKEGFVDVRAVDSIGGVSGYVTKYVTKERDPIWVAGGPAWRT